MKTGDSEEYGAVANKASVSLKSDDTAELGVYMDTMEGGAFEISSLLSYYHPNLFIIGIIVIGLYLYILFNILYIYK